MSQPTRPSDLLLERYLLGELPADQQRALDRLLATDAELQARLEALRGSNRDVLAAYPVGWMARQIRRRAAAAPRRVAWPRLALRLWLIPAAAAAALAVVVPRLVRAPAEQSTRLKGSPAPLELFRQSEFGCERLGDASTARAGDLLQIVYRAGDAPYGAILSVDGRGVQTIHLPARGERAAALRSDGPDTLAFSYRLDDAPEAERFCLVTADRPFDLAIVRQALQEAGVRASAPLRLPAGFGCHCITVLKADEQ